MRSSRDARIEIFDTPITAAVGDTADYHLPSLAPNGPTRPPRMERVENLLNLNDPRH